VRLPGRCGPTSLHARPATPVAGEAGGRGEDSCTAPAQWLSTPREGEACRGGEEKRSEGGVNDRLGCRTARLPPPPRLGGGGAVSWGGARVQHLTAGGEVRTPWWLAANWWWLAANWVISESHKKILSPLNLKILVYLEHCLVNLLCLRCFSNVSQFNNAFLTFNWNST
jgi:hypothetical protein